MGLKLEKVIPWGRSMPEYVRMFNLTPDDLKLNILDCAGGPASFNAEMTRQGYKVISCDPVYQFSAPEIQGRIQDTYQTVIEGVRANLDSYVWQDIQSPEHLGEIRMAAMQQFLADFPQGQNEGRYLTDGLPTLPFNTERFDLALCSHFLFTYSEQFSAEFHLHSILEMCRVAKQVRLFPLLNISGEISPNLAPVMTELETRGYTLKVEQVPYQFQKGGNQMLQVMRILDFRF
ncbi:MAG TPA: SAM-dependent methyltransferase [Cyanobacteria bacterium UBA11372]|nr:SAM-dependent methyltransferase [Cyanobacteria bacterium UBA11372]